MKNKKLARKLKSNYVARAIKTQEVKHELAMKMVLERVKIDPEFARDVLYIGGDTLREDVKLEAKKTIQKQLVEKWEKTGLLDGVKDKLPENAILIEGQERIPFDEYTFNRDTTILKNL